MSIIFTSITTNNFGGFFVVIMKLSPEAIKEFIEIYKQEYGIELNENDAQIIAVKFLSLIKKIYRPIPKEVSNVSR